VKGTGEVFFTVKNFNPAGDPSATSANFSALDLKNPNVSIAVD
jgi:hypothetical protein